MTKSKRHLRGADRQYDGQLDPVMIPAQTSKHGFTENADPDVTVTRAEDVDAYGLEHLVGLSVLYVQKRMDPGEVSVGYEMNNRYEILSTNNRRVFLAGEDTDKCDRHCYGKNRPFNIQLFNSYGQAVVLIKRKCNCSLCWWGGRIDGSDVSVTLGTSGQLLGSVAQNCSMCTPHYDVKDSKGQTILKIRGPCCSAFWACCMCCEPAFKVFHASTGKSAGIMQKTFRFEENVSDSIAFAVKFDPNLDAAIKIVLISAIFCIDFSFFEKGVNCSGTSGCVWFQGFIVICILVGIILYFVYGYKK